VLGGLIHDPALLQGVALGYAREDGFLAVYAAGGVRTASWSAARKRPDRAVGGAPAAHCTVCCTVVCMGHQLCAGCNCVSPPLPICLSASLGSEAVLERCVRTGFQALVRAIRTVDRVLLPRSFLGARYEERHLFNCAVWGTRATFGTLGVGRVSGTMVRGT
jgi:hypothetical protein